MQGNGSQTCLGDQGSHAQSCPFTRFPRKHRDQRVQTTRGGHRKQQQVLSRQTRMITGPSDLASRDRKCPPRGSE